MKPYVHTPTTSTQKRIKYKMRSEWIWCFAIAMFIYMNMDDILPGTWYADNMYHDFHDKYRHRLVKQKKSTGNVIPKYTKKI